MTHGPSVVAGTWVRKQRRTRFFAAYAVAWSVAYTGMFFLLDFGHGHESLAAWIGSGVFFFGLAGIGLVFAYRVANAGLLIRSDVIVVRNPLRTTTLAPSEVEAFAPGVIRGTGNGTPCPVLQRRTGRPVGVWALGREGWVWRFKRYEEELQPLCDELNTVLQNVRSSA